MSETTETVRAERRAGTKSAAAFRTISEVAIDLDVPAHVLRFWETRFSQLRPLKRGGGRRYYRPEDVELLRTIRRLLYNDGYTIKGVQKLLREGAAKAPPPSTSPSPLASTPARDGKAVAPRAKTGRGPGARKAGALPALDPATAEALGELLVELEALRVRLDRLIG
ncbi:MAG: MerR family transcriptional regulator [Alphaproteobacteria bacterium]|nr:MerR family transcriptional regulator [Alphaproteobacteria bacterium]